LKQLTAALVYAIEIEGVAGQKSSHQGGNRHVSCAQKKMRVIGHKRPGQARSTGRRQELFQTREKIIAIIIVEKNPEPLYTPDHYVM
jgi:2-oxoglutarate dehydrogenase complex dehydrogenase (E1) component-like enzyme